MVKYPQVIKVLVLVVPLLIFTHCASHRYLLSGSGNDKYFLITYISNLREEGKITSKPLLVIDGNTFDYKKELKESKLLLTKKDIKKIDYLSKGSQGTADVYGEPGKGGVVLIQTYDGNYSSNRTNKSSEKILVFYDGDTISENGIMKYKPEDIASIEMVHSKDEIEKITNGNYDGVIYITSVNKAIQQYRKEFARLSTEYAVLVKDVPIDMEYKQIEYVLDGKLLEPKGKIENELTKLTADKIARIDIQYDQDKLRVVIKTKEAEDTSQP